MSIRVLAIIAASMCLACDTPEPGSVSGNVAAPSDVFVQQPPVPGRVPPLHAGLGSNVIIGMFDNCDAETFNANIRPGACVRNGGMKFDQFIALLTRLGFVGPWHFSRPVANARVGQTLVVTNHGGEDHTFTEVEEFGGGFVQNLNDLSGNPTPAPECLNLAPGDFVAPGQTFTEVEDEAGNEHYQCCIHPWMRLNLHVTEK